MKNKINKSDLPKLPPDAVWKENDFNGWYISVGNNFEIRIAPSANPAIVLDPLCDRETLESVRATVLTAARTSLILAVLDAHGLNTTANELREQLTKANEAK